METASPSTSSQTRVCHTAECAEYRLHWFMTDTTTGRRFCFYRSRVWVWLLLSCLLSDRFKKESFSWFYMDFSIKMYFIPQRQISYNIKKKKNIYIYIYILNYNTNWMVLFFYLSWILGLHWLLHYTFFVFYYFPSLFQAWNTIVIWEYSGDVFNFFHAWCTNLVPWNSGS